MKILFLALLCACTQKYADYDLIRKVDFEKKRYERPISVLQVLPKGKDALASCFNQWLFFSNAEKEKDRAISMMVKTLCPTENYLLNAHMTETWWTTIVFTRSCVDIETTCADERRTK